MRRALLVGKKNIQQARKMSTLFADAHQASNYALHRPDYPDELFEKVYAYSLHTGGEGIVLIIIILRV